MNYEKYLKNLEKEIKKLEKEIENIETKNKKIEILKRIKMFYLYMRKISPYIISPTIIYVLGSLIKATPFHLDDTKIYMREKKEFDSYNNIRYEQQYEKFEEETPILKYYSKWEKINDNEYKKTIKIYNIDKIREEFIKKIVEENNIDELNNLLLKPTRTQIEIRNNVSEQELNKDSYLQSITFTENKKEYIFVKQPMQKELADIMLFIILSLIGEIPTSIYRMYFSNFNYKDSIKELYNVKELRKKLEIKNNNYNRLKR